MLGEIFELSTKPITRKRCLVGSGETAEPHYPYMIGPACTGCGASLAVCPQDFIRHEGKPFEIEQDHCLHCGNCWNACPVHAVVKQ